MALVKMAALNTASTSATVVGGTMRTCPSIKGAAYVTVTRLAVTAVGICCISAPLNASAVIILSLRRTAAPTVMRKPTPSLYCAPLASGESGVGGAGGGGGLASLAVAGTSERLYQRVNAPAATIVKKHAAAHALPRFCTSLAIFFTLSSAEALMEPPLSQDGTKGSVWNLYQSCRGRLMTHTRNDARLYRSYPLPRSQGLSNRRLLHAHLVHVASRRVLLRRHRVPLLLLRRHLVAGVALQRARLRPAFARCLLVARRVARRVGKYA
jgi:hypothetical protein